jgi:hypothetical protein
MPSLSLAVGLASPRICQALGKVFYFRLFLRVAFAQFAAQADGESRFKHGSANEHAVGDHCGDGRVAVDS